jgi:dTDP-4-dehydrorhamnose 3,5-epimerase-like enzyme
MELSLAKLINFESKDDARGALTIAQLGAGLPFEVRRVYWLHATKPGVSRGFHAHKKLRQVCVCLAGSVRVVLFDGQKEESIVLTANQQALYLEPGLWREMHDFSADCLFIVFADAEYDEADYIRDRAEFIRYRQASRG